MQLGWWSSWHIDRKSVVEFLFETDIRPRIQRIANWSCVIIP